MTYDWGGRISDDVQTSESEGGEGRERIGQLGTWHTGDGAGGDTGSRGGGSLHAHSTVSGRRNRDIMTNDEGKILMVIGRLGSWIRGWTDSLDKQERRQYHEDSRCRRQRRHHRQRGQIPPDVSPTWCEVSAWTARQADSVYSRL